MNSVHVFVLQYLLLNAVCCSLVNKSKAPGQEEWDSEDSVWTTIQNLGKDISGIDPQFLLKVCVSMLCVGETKQKNDEPKKED